ncbi:MAG: DUF4038 domain-containing protein [Candidatus Sumerlaeia bacterium]|nr:DUF4038 domain-containing protein [Candidatus Sumerlaeia bacterium]
MKRMFFVVLCFFMGLPISPTTAGIHDIAYPSALNKQDIPIKVYTPPGYESGTERYPVVYNLHGGGGSPERQWDRTRATLTDAMDNRRVRPMIYVYVNGLGNSEFVNTADGRMIERSIIEELIPFVDSRYRTIASKEGRAIEGFSMGGFGCLSVAFRNPEKFCAVVSYGAALTITGKGKNYRSPEHFAEHNPWALVKANTETIRKGVRLRMVCGEADGLFQSNAAFKDLLTSLSIPVDWVPVAGVAHNTMGLYEEKGLESLRFLEESFAIAAKGGPMNVPVRRTRAAERRVAGMAVDGEPAPFRPSGPLPRLKVSENGRFIVTEDGRPFFFLGDTAWLLFQNLDREGVDKYFEDRATKQFSVVLAHLIPWKHGNRNAYGEEAFVGGDFTKPNEKYWEYCDHIVNQAAAKGLYIGLLPMWCRNYINIKNRPPLLDLPTAQAYGRFVGRRYGGKSHVIWILGGDAQPSPLEIIDAMANGILEGAGADADRLLMSYHPGNGASSSALLHNKSWLDFNMWQSSHDVWRLNYAMIAKDYARQPVKPTLDGEPCYENHPIRQEPKNGWFSDWHVRMKAYWSVFAGACGFVYGGNGIWQMDREGKPPYSATHFNLTWDKALDLPGAQQMKHLRRLIESRPYLSRVPDDKTAGILRSPEGEKEDRIQVTRGADRSWAMYYLTSGQPVQVDLANFKGTTIHAWWFNPRDGKTYDAEGQPTDKPFGQLTREERYPKFDPPGAPGEGCDWVLVLDDAARNYPPPGQSAVAASK